MKNDPPQGGFADGCAASKELPWSDCELFCIHSYAEEAGSRCGWRGKSRDAKTDNGGTRACPRCGRATLLPIPSQDLRDQEA